MKTVIDSYQLSALLDDPNLIILDASYPPVDGQKSALEGVRIQGARKFEIGYFSDQQSELPHMLAPAEEFEKKAQELGINRDSHLVIYDNLGIYSSPRAWWMFKVMGHQNISVLDGGLPKWIQNGLDVEEEREEVYEEGNFKVELNAGLVKSMEEVRESIDTKMFCLIDARSKGRFDGTSPEPRAHLKSGHVENSINVPFQDVLKDGSFKSVEQLKAIFEKLSEDKPLVFSCGSGLTACIVMLAAELVSNQEKAVYDGSWTEWASFGDNPIISSTDK